MERACARLARHVPGGAAPSRSVLADHERQRAERERLRRRLGLAVGRARAGRRADDLRFERSARRRRRWCTPTRRACPPSATPRPWTAWRAHMVELARHLTVIDLWIDAEESRG